MLYLGIMYNHQPTDYDCPFCNRLLAGVDDDYNRRDDIVFQNQYVTASVAPKWWVKNEGHVLVIPNQHYENIYDIPDELAGEVYKAVKKISIAIRATYGCQGTSNRQHNEPAGDQDVWHLHVHVYPRYEGDALYINHSDTRFAPPKERKVYADKLRAFLRDTEPAIV